MIRSLLLILGLLTTQMATAQEIVSAKWDEKRNELNLKVRHGGGCGEHLWGIVFDGKCKSGLSPVCNSKLVHMKGQDDFCEAIIVSESTVKLPAQPFSVYTLNIRTGSKTKSVLITSKKTGGDAKTCSMKTLDGKTKKVAVGESTKDIDGCNTCTCQSSGHFACTELACVSAKFCNTPSGKQVKVGQSFPSSDGCNTCTCEDFGDGVGAVCTELACFKP